MESESSEARRVLERRWASNDAGRQDLRFPPMESQPGKRAGTRSKRAGTERSGAQVLDSPPSIRVARGRTAGAAEEFEASASFCCG
jgi:hypothetical protein